MTATCDSPGGGGNVVLLRRRHGPSALASPEALGLRAADGRIPVRRLNGRGNAVLRDWLRSASRPAGGGPGRIAAPPPFRILCDPETSKPLPYPAYIDLRPLDTMMDTAEMVRDGFGADAHRLRGDAGALNWMALARMDDLHPAAADGSRKAYSILRYMFRDAEGARTDSAYRNLVWTALMLLLEVGQAARPLLISPKDHPSDVVEQVMARPLIRGSRGAMELIGLMYLDDGGSGLVRGAKAATRGEGDRRGGIRDLVAVLGQCERSYDLARMGAAQILRLVPDAGGFRPYKARARKRLAAAAAAMSVAAE